MKSLLSPRAHLFWLLLVLAKTDSAKAQPIELSSPLGETGTLFGTGVKGLSDWTGDGIGELAVVTMEEAGSVYILSGKDFSVVHRLVSPDPKSPSDFGWTFDRAALAEVPDLDGDKIPELAIASSRLGRVEIFAGASGKVLQTIETGDGEAAFLGVAVTSLSTTRPNSVTTLAVSAPACCDLAQEGFNGHIGIFNPVPADLLFTIEGPADTEAVFFGASLANIGDVDGDGRDDLAVGAGSGIRSTRGAASIVSGETGTILNELIPPQSGNLNFRWDVAAVPDVNRDGKADVLVGIGGGSAKSAALRAGHAYLFSGADGKLLRTLLSPQPTTNGGFGFTVAGVPDVTGDGAGELLIGAALNPTTAAGHPGFGEKKMYLINGATGQTIQTFASPYAGDSFGWTIAAITAMDGRLRHLVAGVRREGRVFVFSVRKLMAVKSAEGCQISLITTDEADHELQSSSDLQTWSTVTTWKSGEMPARFLDKDVREMISRFYRTEQTAFSP